MNKCRNNRRRIGILFAVAAVAFMFLCCGTVGHAEKGTHACLALNGEEGVFRVSLSEVPVEAVEVALLFDVCFGEGDVPPRIEPGDGGADTTLTVGEAAGTAADTAADTAAGRVRVLWDGVPPQTGGEWDVAVVFAADTGTATDIRVENPCLWVKTAHGTVVEYPVSVVLFGAPTESEPAPESDGINPPETAAPTDGTDTAAETAVETPVVPTVPTVDAGGWYLGCRESAVRDGHFSVRLLFWQKKDDPLPAVLCMDGGQEVTLRMERLGNTSVLTYTFCGLASDGVCRFLIDTPEGAVEVCYRNGRFAGHAQP